MRFCHLLLPTVVAIIFNNASYRPTPRKFAVLVLVPNQPLVMHQNKGKIEDNISISYVSSQA